MNERNQSARRRPHLAVERVGNTVTVTIVCTDDYAAIELYDQVCAGGREGYIELEIETREAINNAQP